MNYLCLSRLRQQEATRQKQRGAAAIEAAVLFALFFTVFYAIVSYSLPMLMTQAFNHAAASGARAAVAVDRGAKAFDSEADYIVAVQNQARDVVRKSLSWLPGKAHSIVLDDIDAQVDADGRLRVRVAYEGYRDNPMIPVLRMPGIGEVPRLPENLTGEAVVSL